MRIFLVRHGQSKSNVDWTENQRVADHAIQLSEEGHMQAKACGTFINEYLHEHLITQADNESFIARVRMWRSPYTRTRQTAEHIWNLSWARDTTAIATPGAATSIWERRPKGVPVIFDMREHLLLAEQQFGLFDGLSDEEREARYPAEHAYYEKCKKFEGKLWPKMPLGESRIDVAQRVHQSFGTFKRDAEKHGINDVIIVAHGTVNRAFLMMWMHLPYEWMHEEPNPPNCSVRLLEDGKDKGYIFEGFDHPENYKHSTTPETEE
jgi:2,3-bisphosphoglycerate-dependent phosphoglycerate mutase